MIPFSASQVRNRLNEMEVEADETRKGKGKRVESEDAARSDRVVNSESPTPLQSGNMKQTSCSIDGWEDPEDGTYLTPCSGRWLVATLGWLRVFLFFLLLFLVFLLLASTDSVATGFNPVHNPSNRHRVFTHVISTGRNTLLDHGKNILAGSYISGVVSPLGCLSRGSIESGDAKRGRCETKRKRSFVSLQVRVE